jgi:adenine-specific DNA-methyltransferase
VFCAITSATNKLATNKWLLKTDLEKPKGFIEPNTSDFILKNAVISRLDKLEKFEKYFLIKDVGFNYWSEGRGKVRGGSIGSRVFYNGEKEQPNDIPFIKGGDIQKYSISFSNNYLRNNWKTFLDENDTFRFSQELMERVPKIIYRQTSNKIVAAIDFHQNFNDKTIHIIVNKEEYKFDLKAILAILNSKMMNYFFQSFKEEEGRAFAQVKTVDIKNLPFIVPRELVQAELTSVVDEILKEKSEDISSDTTDLQNKIDQLVYSLYDLTEEEIKIIETT